MRQIRPRKNSHLLVLSLALSLVVLVAWLLPMPPMPAAAQGGGQTVTGIPVAPERSGVVNFAQMVARQPAAPPVIRGGVSVPSPLAGTEDDRRQNQAPISAPRLPGYTPSTPAVASPSPQQNYLAEADVATVEGYSWIPPDTTGAVGIDHVFATHNSNYRILRKSDGAQVSLLSMAQFWASVGVTATSSFDPRIAYDPYNNRWILAAANNRSSSSSAILVGISQTSDPTGLYNLYSVDADSADLLWADYPNLGFNKNWIAISVNMYLNSTGVISETRILAIDYPTLRTGTFSGHYFIGIADLSVNPVSTYSSAENTLYMPVHFSSARATYALDSLTGTSSSLVFTYGGKKTNSMGAWTMPCNEILPQATGLPTETRKIESNDARIINSVFRNGNIWYAQTIGLPSGGGACNPTRTAAQWVKIDTSGNFVDGGRIDDPTATASNGGKWYAYPSIGVNSLGDVLVGFTQFSSDQHPAAGYAFRSNADAAGTLRDPYIYKSGEGYYEKDFGTGRNRWGDYSSTVVDVNDIDLWTIQEYAAVQAGTGNGSGRWGTWWAKVSPWNNFQFLPFVLK